MRHWQTDPDLARIRDKAALDKLPVEERQACQRLWTDVTELLKKADRAMPERVKGTSIPQLPDRHRSEKTIQV